MSRRKTRVKSGSNVKRNQVSTARERTATDVHSTRLALKSKHLLVIIILAFSAYVNTLNNYFVLDDSLVILSNEFTQKGIAGIPDIWTHDMFVGTHGREFDLAGGRYRPLSMTVFAVLYELFGDYTNEKGVKSRLAFSGHLINILFFIATCALIYLVLLRLIPTSNGWIPFTTAVLFSVHPIHTEVVANIKSLDEILSLFFLLCSLFYLLKDSTKHLILACSFYLLSLLSKENTITFLAIIPVLYFFFRRIELHKVWRKLFSMSGIAIIYLLLRELFSGGFLSDLKATNLMDNPFLGMDLWSTKIPTVVLIAGKYLKLLFFPYPLSYDYSYDSLGWRSWSEPWVWVTALILIAVFTWSVGIAYKRWNRPTVDALKPLEIAAFGILFYAISYSIVSNVFFNIGTYMGERFIYMASLGFCIAASALLSLLPGINRSAPASFTIKSYWPLILIVPLAFYTTVSRNMDWKDSSTLYVADAHKVDRSARARMFLGIQYLNTFNKTGSKDIWNKSISELQAAVNIYPDFYHAHYNLGLAYQANNDINSAVRSFERVLEIQPRHLNATYFIGVCYGGLGQPQRAIEYIEKGIKHGYTGVDRYFNLGAAYGQSGDFNKALEAFEQARLENPDNPLVYKGLAVTYENLGNVGMARAMYTQAQALDPAIEIPPTVQ